MEATRFSSRFRSDVATLFDVFCEVGAPTEGEKLPPVLTKYPEDYNEEQVLKSIRQFAFPCDMKQSDNGAVQYFSFVLTDSLSKYSFGFCRYTPRNDVCICFLSGFFWPRVFYKALDQLSLAMNGGSQEEVENILTRIYHTDIPNSGDTLRFECNAGRHNFEVKVPDLRKLPTLRGDKYMIEFYNAVSPRQMLAIYSSLLKERRIVFTGNKLSQLSSCIHATSSLLYPMAWQSVFIPVLPASLFEMIMAPMPYLIGVPKQIIKDRTLKDIGEIVVVDIDEKTLESPFDDVSTMPNEVINYLKSQLKSTDMNDSVARCFLRATVLLFGDYRCGFVRDDQTGNVVFDKEKFVEEQRPSFQGYLSSLLGADSVQYLERFIHDRLELLKQGVAVNDEFEMEITRMDLKARSQTVNSEALQQAMQSVRENASDVIGALKDKVSGIQIGTKLTKLTPKEIRKSANWHLKKKTNGIEPLSFDNVQWQDNASSREWDDSPSDSLFESTPAANNVPVGNLIDFDSPPPVNNPFLDLQTNGSSSSSQPPQHVFVDPFNLPIAPPPPAAQRPAPALPPTRPPPAWEKFE